MKIEDRRIKDNVVCFNILNDGDVFEFESGMYIKSDGFETNAIALDTGERVGFYNTQLVTKLCAKLVIEGVNG